VWGPIGNTFAGPHSVVRRHFEGVHQVIMIKIVDVKRRDPKGWRQDLSSRDFNGQHHKIQYIKELQPLLIPPLWPGTSLNRKKGRVRAGLRGGGNGGNSSWWNLLVSNKIIVRKIFVIQKRFKNTTLPLYSNVALSIKVPQQQLISLQVWLSASCSNRYWIAYKHFRFFSVQIHLILLVTFS